MTRKPSIDDVAKLAGVSRTTVSYVLNNVTRANISQETRERVLAAARELNYHPNASARSLALKRINTLGLILCTSQDRFGADTFLPAVIYGITSLTATSGYRLLIEPIQHTNSADAYMQLVREGHISGMILTGVRHDDEQLQRLREDRFPAVLWGWVPESGLPSVDVDNVRAARMAVEHLIKLGHKRIACITNAPVNSPESANRLLGYQRALEQHGLTFDKDLVRYGNYHAVSGFEAMQVLLALPERPTAVFVASDVVAFGVLRAARAAGVNVPDDLAVVGFDDIDFAQYVAPPLTTVRVPARKIGTTAARILLDIVRTREYPDSILLDTELVVRESCGAYERGWFQRRE